MSRLWLLLIALPWLLRAIEPGGLEQLLGIKRVFVDKLDGDETALQMRDMIISALQQTHLFIVTENQDRADAFLRGSSEDLVFNEQHSSSDGVNAHVNASSGSSAYKGGSFNKAVGGSLGENESSHSSERRHEASAAIRLVNKDGDVIWSSTQESQEVSSWDRWSMWRTRSRASSPTILVRLARCEAGCRS